MSLKRKIALGFFMSAAIIAVLSGFEYINFIEIRKEIGFLELTDTIRSKSLQLRRHEKNFFLYGPQTANTESAAIGQYLSELDTLLSDNLPASATGEFSTLKDHVHEYGQGFKKIESSINSLLSELKKSGSSYPRYRKLLPLIDLAIFERPLLGAEFLQKELAMPPDHQVVKELKMLDTEINNLRRHGEDIIMISKDLDHIARKNAEDVISTSKIAILIFFPLFLITGIGMLFFIARSIVIRLNRLGEVVERTGKGDFPRIPMPSQKDEVGALIWKFNEMEEQLAQREEEIEKKNRELLQSKKLAAIGTLAAGVAHELNNPLNNIYISAQMLVKETGEENCPPEVKEIVNDIVGQSVRVKGIVGALLEFARGKELRLNEVNLGGVIMGAYKLVSSSVNTSGINLTIDIDPKDLTIEADPEQMERVFINIFTNAVAAMAGSGGLNVRASKEGKTAKIRISDTGVGIPPEMADKIFEPFYTTKDRGTGLGLAIIFNIIKKHEGEIHVESLEGKGASFVITLPLKRIT